MKRRPGKRPPCYALDTSRLDKKAAKAKALARRARHGKGGARRARGVAKGVASHGGDSSDMEEMERCWHVFMAKDD